MNLEIKIRDFSQDPKNISLAWALIKVGHDRMDHPDFIMQHVIAHILLKFHGIPLTPGTSN